MFKTITDHLEMRQLRKDHKEKQKRKQALILMAVMGVVLLMMVAIESVQPAKPAKAAKPAAAKSLEIQKIDEFVNVVTMPMDQLSDEDLALLDSVAKDPCYEEGAKVEQALMAEEIKKCKGL